MSILNVVAGLSIAGCLAVPATAADNPMSFSIEVSLSPKAAAKLAAMKERIEAAALWYGDPTPAARKRADETGNINLGSETLRLPGTGGRLDFTGKPVKTDRIAWVAKREVKLNLNVYSARQGGPDNVLDCTFFDDDIRIARAKPVAVLCKLIGEK